MRLRVKILALIVCLLVSISSGYGATNGSLYNESLYNGSLWTGTLWQSSRVNLLDYYLHIPTDRGSIYFRDYVSRTDATTTIPGTRPYNGTTVPVNRPTLGTDGLRDAPVVDNLITGTAPVDLTQWTGIRSSISQNQVAAPYGSDLADLFGADDTPDTSHLIYKEFSVSDNADVTYSLYIKKQNLSWFRTVVKQKSGATNTTYFNLDSCTVGTNPLAIAANIVPYGDDGWYIITVRFNSLSGATTPAVYCGFAESDGDTSLDGDVSGSGHYIWGAQVTASPYKLYDNFTGTATVTEAGTTVLPLTAGMSAAMGGDGSEVGDELIITNADFSLWSGDNPTGYVVSAEDANNYITEHANGARIVSNGTNINITRTIGVTSNQAYRVSIAKSNHVSGYIRLYLYDTTNSAVILSATNLSGSNTNGTFSYDFLAPAGCNNVNVVMYRELSTATDYVMNSWSLKPLTPQATLTCTWKPMFDSGDLASGTDKISGWNLTSGWTATADCTINDLNTFTTTVANRGVYKTTILTVGKQYEIHIVGSTTAASGMSVRNDIGTTGQSIVGVGGTSFDSTFRVSWSQGTGPFLQNLSAGTTDITTFSITEISTDTILTAGDMSLKYIAGLDQLEFSDGTNTAVKSLTCVAETAYAITAKWDGVNSLMKIAVDGVYGTETAFTGSFNPASDPYLRPLVSPQFQWLNDVDIMKEMTW